VESAYKESCTRVSRLGKQEAELLACGRSNKERKELREAAPEGGVTGVGKEQVKHHMGKKIIVGK